MNEEVTRGRTIVGLFSDQAQAESCVHRLREAGFSADDLGYVGRDAEGHTVTTGEVHDHAEGAVGGAAGGAITGGVIGGVLGALAAGLIPGVGPIIAGGMLAGIVAGAPAGAAVGGLAGGLRGAGVPEEDATYYDTEFNQNHKCLVTCRPGERTVEAETIIRECGGHMRGSAIGDAVTRTTGTTPAGDTTLLEDQRPIGGTEVAPRVGETPRY